LVKLLLILKTLDEIGFGEHEKQKTGRKFVQVNLIELETWSFLRAKFFSPWGVGIWQGFSVLLSSLGEATVAPKKG
jgi:hypothetical protein